MTRKKKTDLREGERLRKDGRYEYRIMRNGIPKSVTSKTLEGLREKKEALNYMKYSGTNVFKYNITLDDEYIKWKETKRGLKGNTLCNYCYMYEKFAFHEIGRKKIVELEYSDIKRFYNKLYDEKHLQANTIDTIHSVIHQVLDLAKRDNIIKYNPSDQALKELKKEDQNKIRQKGYSKAKFLSKEEEQTLFGFLKDSIDYGRWYSVLRFLSRTGLRVGELCALQNSDIDYDNRIINVNKTLEVYTVKTNTGKSKTVYEINTTKTNAGERELFLTDEVIELIRQEKEYQKYAGIKCNSSVNGYNDFLFLTNMGSFFKGSTLNKAIVRVVTACNSELVRNNQMDKLIPHTHSHMFRHTYNTRMKEAGIDVEDRMKVLGQTDPEVNMKIYTHTTLETVKNAMVKTNDYCYNQLAKAQ